MMFFNAFSGVKANYLVSYVSIEVGVRYEGDRVRFSGPDWPEFRDLPPDENIHGFIWVQSYKTFYGRVRYKQECLSLAGLTSLV